MRDEDKTKELHMDELMELRCHIAQLEKGLAQQKAVAAALLESEGRYRQMAENIREVFWLSDLDSGRMLYVSPAYEETWGRTCESLYADPSSWLEAIHPADRDKVDKAVALCGSEGYSLEYRVVRPDGSIRWVLDRGLPIHDQSGAVYRIAGLAEDITDRRRAVEDSRKFEFIANTSRDFMTLIDRSYRYEAANDAYCKLHQKSREEILSSTVSDLWGREKFDGVIKAKLDECFTGKEVHDEDWFSFNGHEQRCYEICYSPYFDDDGKVSHAVVITHDITEPKLAGEALRRSEEKYRSIFDAAPIGIFRTTPDGRLLDANSMLSRMLGYPTPQEMIATTNRTSVAEALYADPEARLKIISDKALVCDGIWGEVQIRLRRKDGETMDARLQFRAVADGPAEPVILEGFLEDISERLQAEHALRASEIKYRIIADNTYDWEYWVNPEGRYLYSSPSCERITGSTASEYEDDPQLLSRIIHPDDKHQYGAHLEECQTSGTLCECEFRIIHRDGTTRWIGHVYQPVFDAEGHYLGRRGSHRDITERKLGEQALLEAHKELERRVQERTAELAHANESLRESQALFESLARVSPVGIFRADVEGNCTYLNERWRQMAGIGSEEACGDRCLGPLHPDDRQRISEEWHKCVHGSSPFKSEYRFQQPDGSITFLLGQAVPEVDQRGETIGYVGTITDITEQKMVEEALRESEEQFRAVFHTLRDGLLMADRKTKNLVEGNPAMQAMLGYSDEELRRLGVADIHPEEDVPLVMKQFEELANGEITLAHDVPVKRKDGSIIYADISASFPVSIKGKEIIMALFRDTTERKITQEALQNACRELQDIIEFLPDATFVIDRERKVVAWNRAIEEMTGVAKKDILGRGDYQYAVAFYGEAKPIMIDLVMGDRIQAEDTRYTVLERKGKTVFGEAFVPMTFKEKAAHVWATASALYNVQGHLIGAIESVRDITNLKQAEEALRESETRYRQLFATVPDAVFIFDAETRQFIDVNESALSLYGYTREEFLNLKLVDITAEPELSEATIKKTLAAGKTIRIPLRRHRRRDGTVFPVELSGGTFVLSGRRVLVAALRDITQRLRVEGELSRYREHLEELVRERTSELSRANEQLTSLIEDHRRTEKVLKAREEFLDAIIENIPDMVFVKDAQELRFVRFNRAGEELLGHGRKDLIGKSDFDFFPKKEADFFTEKDREVLQNLCLVDIPEETILTRNMGHRILHTKKIPILDQDGNPEYLLGISQDITERKQAEAALLKSEEKYRALIETTDTGYLILDSESRVIDANNEYVRLSGHTRFEEILGRSVVDWTAEHDRERNAFEVNKCLQQGFVRNLEVDYVDKQGGITPVEINATVIRVDHSMQILSLCRDIAERRRTAEALQVSENRYKMLLNSVTDYIFTIEMKDGLPVSTTHGQGCLAVTGFTAQEYARMPFLWYEMIHPEDQHAVKEHAETVLRGEARDPLEHRIVHKNGETRWVRNVMVPRYDARGSMVACDGLISDITERKTVEQELKQTNTYLENVFENSPDAIGIVDAFGRFIRWNRMAAELYGYTFNEMKAKSGFDLYADKDELKRMLAHMRQQGSVKKWEMKMRKKDGTIVPFEISIGLLMDNKNKALGSVAVARDLSGIKETLAAIRAVNEQLSKEITERRRAEEALIKSEKTLKRSQRNLRSLASQLFTIQETERNRISKELHDGLGQDLTVLKIYLASIQNKLKRDQEALKGDCEFLLRRIDESLENMRRLCRDLSPYLLEELGLEASLKHLFEEVCRRNRLRCSLEMEDISQYLSKRDLASVYRIFQEALTNIVKHSGATRMTLSIKREAEYLSFMITDNGKGFDVREEIKRPASQRGMGLFAMEERGRMLGGAIHISSQSGQGTTISLSIPIKGERKR